MLTELDFLPEHFFETDARDLYTLLPTPTLIHLTGRREQTLFVSILLHGNEDTGLKAMQALLQKYKNKTLPRSLSLFIGNIDAARVGLRRLPDQPDYNRVWSYDCDNLLPEHEMAQEVVRIMTARKVFASIDIHNNTGLNPHYACVNKLDDAFLQLATLFSRIVVYFTSPKGVQSGAFAALCPSVTLECGKPGLSSGAEHAAEFVDAVLNLSKFPSHPVHRHDFDLFHTVATVKVPDHVSLGVDDTASELNLINDIDHYNFRELLPDTYIAQVKNGKAFPIEAWDEAGDDIASHYFKIDSGKLTTQRPVMPAMLTRDVNIIRQDCLCYLMERMTDW
ncbi:MAG: succinylglutamate desuccinylase/aspartoacylase family protein [Methylococcaceae bacterium]|nr:succinylglutamate desuccinylase/aspartoacylase family protein [Methylococcaceae bacterium]